MTNNRKLCRLMIASGAGLSAVSITAQAFAAGASQPGLPQLDISTWPSQIFWLVVIFGVGYLIMAKMVTPKIGNVLEERRARLDDNLGKAREASAEAAKIRADYEADLEKARGEAADYARNAATEAAQKAATVDAKAAKKLLTKVTAAETKLAAARAEAMESLHAVAADAALDAVKGLTGFKTTKAQAEKTVKSVAKAMTPQEAN